ncbi:alpha-(1,3)-fucosyltransferase 10 isoform X3 [Cryptotermes secundus]|uniref:alpha-(1,3)-fucosyltransferase 10 isoform X3 n=1 Tax=Cryptotermes secundus TaxID=105785 RepID=UPI000CD7AAF9|nr:alpha-(1,3)-fucosyltransferase 10 isoform X3 [Cryptotermes secundus]
MGCLLQMRLQTLLWCTGSVIVVVLLVQLLIQIYSEDVYPHEFFHHEYSDNESIQGQKGAIKHCGAVKCFFTEDRRYRSHNLTKALMFYGSQFDLIDLPLPRDGLHHDWALLHEESPKNTPALSHLEALEMFNVTATFSRFSHFPLTLQYLKSADVLTDLKYFVPVERKNELLSELAPVLYVHSDCSTPLERDAYATELMKYIPVDSYGKCVQNRHLPEHLADPMESMDSDEFFHFVARYKFTLSFENAVCDDYITEKLWRPLVVGSVPIYMGSPSVRDWLPNNNSAILAMDFRSPKELAQYLHVHNSNITKYKSFLKHKLGAKGEKVTNKRLTSALETRKWGIDNDFEKGNFIEHFECFLCEHEHKKLNGQRTRLSSISEAHYDCPIPVSPLTNTVNRENWWVDQWHMGKCEARVLRHFVEIGNTEYKYHELYDKVNNMFLNKAC